MHEATRVLRAGLPEAVQGQPFLPGPTFAGTYHLAGDPSSSAYSYGRYHNPSWTLFEQALSELEGGDAVVFPSGMAAISALFAVVLQRGDVLVMPSDGYYTVRLLAEEDLRAAGIAVRTLPTVDGAREQDLQGASLLLLETPSNPGLDVCDIAELAAMAHGKGVLVAVVLSTATTLGQRPLDLGADFSVASDTKALSGHGDVVLGHVGAKDNAWGEKLRAWRTRSGCIPGPMEVWLAHRSLATFVVRMEQQCKSALVVAQFLEGHPEVQGVRYPGLPADPAHALASRQMQRYGCVIGFTLRHRAHAEQFLDSCSIVSQATSFGGVRTTAERRARWGGDTVPEAFIRLSVGCEDVRDLIEDMERALEAL